MRVICINNNGHERSLTNGKEYKILSSDKILSCSNAFYSLIDDNGSRIKVWETRFEKIPPRHQNQRCSILPEIKSKLRHVTTDGEIFDCISKATNHQKSIDDSRLFKGCEVAPYLDATLEDMVDWAKSEPESYELLKQYVEK